MDATARFAELVQQAPSGLAASLSEAALLIAAHARAAARDEPLDVDAYLGRLDSIAARCAAATGDAVLHELFEVEGLFGDHEEYYDPRNSYLDQVLDRKLGLPITLSLVVVEVGRRAGVVFEPIGMPGHFLVRHDGVLLDPYDGGRRLTVEECEERFRSIHGSAMDFDASLLETATPHDIVTRMLANLRQIFLANGDSVNLEWVLRLRALLPGATVDDRTEHAGVLAAIGKLDAAADLLEEVAPTTSDERAEVLNRKARQLRARLN